MNPHRQSYYTRQDLSAALLISLCTIKRHEKTGALVATLVGPRIVRYHAADVEEFLKRQKKDDQPDPERSLLVNARVPVSLVEERYNQWKIGGYVVANRYKHDSPVETPLGVQLEKGHWHKSGGTPTEPRVTGDTDMSITVVMRRSFAERTGLETIASEDQALRNPLAEVGIRALIDELRRRSFNFGSDGGEGLPA